MFFALSALNSARVAVVVCSLHEPLQPLPDSTNGLPYSNLERPANFTLYLPKFAALNCHRPPSCSTCFCCPSISVTERTRTSCGNSISARRLRSFSNVKCRLIHCRPYGRREMPYCLPVPESRGLNPG